MPADLYRDAQLGIRARLEELEARLREREAEVTDEFWSSLDQHMREHLEKLRRGLNHIHADSLEELARAEGRLAAYVDELEALIARLPTIEAEWLAVPEKVDDPPHDEGTVIPTLRTDELERSFRAIVRERSRDAEIVYDGLDSCIARFRHRDAPFALRATAVRRGFGRIADVVMQLVTSVARATPRLLVRHEALLASVGKSIGLYRELEVGDVSFDGLFLIRGTREAAQRLLVPAIRGLLLTLARFDVPTLEIDPPNRIASLTWCFEPNAPALDAALRVLTFIRGTDTEVRFRR